MSKIKIPNFVKKLTPKKGGGNKEKHTACIMEAVALISPNTNSFTDHPRCVTTSLNDFMIGVNDQTNSDKVRKRLIKFAPRLLETTGKAKELTTKTNEWVISYVKKYKIDPVQNNSNPWMSTKKDITKGKNLRVALENAKIAIETRYPSDRIDTWRSYIVSVEVELKRMRDIENLLNYILPENTHITPEWDNLRPFVRAATKA